MTADGHGVVAIMREVGVSKTTVWRWQDYFAEAGVDGLIKGRSKPPGRKPLSAAMKLKVVEKTVAQSFSNLLHDCKAVVEIYVNAVAHSEASFGA